MKLVTISFTSQGNRITFTGLTPYDYELKAMRNGTYSIVINGNTVYHNIQDFKAVRH